MDIHIGALRRCDGGVRRGLGKRKTARQARMARQAATGEAAIHEIRITDEARARSDVDPAGVAPRPRGGSRANLKSGLEPILNL